MAQVVSLEGLRSQYVTSLYGRRLSLDINGALIGPTAYRQPISGFDSTGATTGYNTTGETTLSAYGVSVVGTTANASQAYTIQAPIPGVVKTIFNPTTATFSVGTTGAGAYIALSSAGGAVSGTTITLARGGVALTMIGLTTAAWGVISANDVITSASTRVTIA